MFMLDINGKEVNIDVRQNSYPLKENSKSKLQKSVQNLLLEKYPRSIILEEFFIPGSRLSVDFFLPREKIVVEINGRQHYEHIPYFHKDRSTSKSFARQVHRDVSKENWVNINNFKLIIIDTEEDVTKI